MTESPSEFKGPNNYIVGIDLGTTNSALTFTRPDHPVTVLAVPQLVAPGQLGTLPTLPSFLYLPHPGELHPTEAKMPWSTEGGDCTSGVVGAWARDRGSLVPDRVVASAKSWLCASHVDRDADLLPWQSEITSGKCSPVTASKRYLEHLIAAFAADRRAQGEDVDIATCSVVLTVPASFDEVARSLTYDAARQAGLREPVLLEEPLAAFYAWLDLHERDWRTQVQPGDLILVCDIGGGTSDFSLIAVSDVGGNLQLERISVGDHLLLGGDNMDLALAHGLKAGLEEQGRTVDHWQFLALVGAARSAKERLLSDSSLEELPVAVANRGASLFAGTVTTQLKREQVLATLLEGFLPHTSVSEMPKAQRAAGIREFGLIYESDPAISRHLARFLRRSWVNATSHNKRHSVVTPSSGAEYLMPTAVLFNGGVFKAPQLKERVMELLRSWSVAQVKELGGNDCELAVARGAAYYGKLRATGRGVRVQSGTARSYYVGLEETAPAVPGLTPKVKGLCLVPQGTDEGTEIELKAQQFGLVVGEPVDFRFFSSTIRGGDEAGSIVDDAGRNLEESARLHLTLSADGVDAGEVVPVRLDAVVNEVGMLQIFMKDTNSERKWNLEFNVRTHDTI